MKLNSGEFETDTRYGSFDIIIRQESDWSQDGGHSFEDVSNLFELDKKNVRHLIEELQAFMES